jgi:HTH-type transcriptional regulator / antitoxin HigA
MSTVKSSFKKKLPGRFDELVHVMPPRAIRDDIEYDNIVDVIDRLMALGKLTKGQSVYLETLVQLVQVYEATHHGIDTSDISGLDSLKYLLRENSMSGADLARLLGVHASMGAKILRGERALTVDHIRKLATRFKVSAQLFIE